MKFTPVVLALLVGLAPAQDARPELGQPVTASVGTTDAVPTRVATEDGPRSWTKEQRMARAEELINAPLSVNGQAITPARIRQALVTRHGRMQLDSRRLDLMIESELAMREAEGQDVSSLGIDDQAIEAKVQEVIDSVAQQYPDKDIDDVLASNNLSRESLRRQIRQTGLFDQVFLPVDRSWPATTVEALKGTMGEDMVAQLQENWASSQSADAQAQGAAMWNQMIRQMVVQELVSAAIVQTPADGLPDQVAQRVNGEDTLVADVWPELAPIVHPEDVKRIRAYLARMEAAHQELFARGAWLTDEEFAEVYGAEKAVGEGGPWNIDMVVLTMKRYPDMNSYKEVLRGQRSYEKMIDDTITEEVLTEWLPRAGRLLGLGEVRTEVIHIASFDHTVNAWHDAGWAAAEAEALEVVEQLVASEGADWDRLLAEHSDFYDAPVQAQAGQAPPPQQRNGGRFGTIHRNLLMQLLGESEYTVFVDGYSIADEIYYHQNVGSLDGPFKGIHGYYITRVDGRTGPKKPILLTDENIRSMVREDYVMQNFVVFAQEALQNAEVVGL